MHYDNYVDIDIDVLVVFDYNGTNDNHLLCWENYPQARSESEFGVSCRGLRHADMCLVIVTCPSIIAPFIGGLYKPTLALTGLLFLLIVEVLYLHRGLFWRVNPVVKDYRPRAKARK